MGFSQALSGLNSAATNLDVVGNNIANSQTVGFKGSGAQFADVYAGAQVGQGVRVSTVLQDFSNGTLESTGRNLDLGINGNGFFRFTRAPGSPASPPASAPAVSRRPCRCRPVPWRPPPPIR